MGFKIRKFKLKKFNDGTFGELLKLAYRLGIMRPVYGITGEKRSKKVVISLTSYGRRVKSVLYYNICSLLRQDYKPDVIVLWLDEKEWNDNNLPRKIKRLKKKGLTVRYCEDIRSYKKLIPALKNYPDDIIITVDDDLFYKRHMVGDLMKAYEANPNCIHAHRAHQVRLGDDGKLISYEKWPFNISNRIGKDVFCTSGGGVLYQKSLLHEDVDRKDLFLTLTPTADDIWFYFMAILKGTPISVLVRKHSIFHNIDFYYQHFHDNACLAQINIDCKHNDAQIHAVMNHYGLTDSYWA